MHPAPSRDWTPTVLLVMSLAMSVAAFTWILDRWQRREGAEPALDSTERPAPAGVDLWVGDLGDDVRLVLTSVWGDVQPDLEHDASLRTSLKLPAEAPFSWYRLLLFNRGSAPRTVSLADASLVLEGPGGPARLTSLAELVRRGLAQPSPALARVLKGLGALHDRVEMPAGSALPVMVCFDRHVDLSAASSVAAGDGTAFRRRRIPRGELQRLLADPDESLVRDL
jgi:hypothetical protein